MTTTRPLPQVVAHRGASAAYPPGNTLDAFRGAAALGADGVELDVRRSRDAALVVHHDPHLPDGRPVHDVLAADLPGWVPILGDALAVCAAAGLTVNLEIKNSPLEDDFDDERTMVNDVLVAVAVAGGWDASNLLISSFDAEALRRVGFRRGDPATPFPTGQLLWDPSTALADVEAAAEAGHAAVNPWASCVDVTLVDRARQLGLAVNVWTVDDEAEMRTLIEVGVDAIITNVPDVLRAVLADG